MSKEGILSGGQYEVEALRSMADWYDCRELDISGESGDVVIATKYEGLVCKGILNLGSSDATVVFKTQNNQGSSVSFPLSAGAFSGKLPSIHTIVQSGTDDDLLLYFQKR